MKNELVPPTSPSLSFDSSHVIMQQSTISFIMTVCYAAGHPMVDRIKQFQNQSGKLVRQSFTPALCATGRQAGQRERCRVEDAKGRRGR